MQIRNRVHAASHWNFRSGATAEACFRLTQPSGHSTQFIQVSTPPKTPAITGLLPAIGIPILASKLCRYEFYSQMIMR